MADWSKPTTLSDYPDVLSELGDRLDQTALMFADGTGTSIPSGAIRYNRSTDTLQYRVGFAWTDLNLSIAGGGTGAASASAARTVLGLGSMATQDNSAVNITGGTITGVNLAASTITSGVIALNRGGTGQALALGASETVMNSDGAVVRFSTIGNNSITAAAGIVYSKLNLTASIVNADIANAAAIAYSKLALTGSVVNGDIVTLAATKLTGTINEARLPSTITAITITTLGVDVLGVTSGASLNGTTAIADILNLNLTTVASASAGAGSIVAPEEYISVNVNGSARLIPVFLP